MRLRVVSITGASLYAGSMIGLYNFWYKDYPQSSFHFFNDNHEWMQVDKAGHAFTAYYEGVYGYQMLRWAGVPHKKAAIYGASWGFFLQTPIEILDGFSKGWGASAGDLTANTFGAALVVGQELLWEEQVVTMKFSFTPSPYPAMFQGRSSPLGNNIFEKIIKDYNGQTYWLSTGIYHFLPDRKFPKWLNIAVGYGADGLLRGTYEDQVNDQTIPSVIRQRQFYLSLDVDLKKIPTKNKYLSTLFSVVSFIKIPAPGIEYATHDRWRFHILYF